MKHKTRRTEIHTWYGLDAATEIERTRWHRAGFGRFMISHPAIVNCLLRRGLSDAAYQHLCVHHEIGHLQMLPFELLYTLFLFGMAIENGHTDMLESIVILLSCFAVWEILAESYVIKRQASGYKSHYEHVSLMPRVLFWSITIGLMIAGWFVALA